MSRKQFKVAGSTHEKKLSKKERKAQIGKNINKAEITPTKEDTVQIKNLTLYTCISIALLLMLMYWIFISGL